MKHLTKPTLNQAKSLQLAHSRKLLLRMWKRMFGRRRFIMPDWWRVKLWNQQVGSRHATNAESSQSFGD